MNRRSHPLVLLAALFAMLLAGCASADLGEGDAARVLSGEELLLAVDGDWEPVEPGATLPEGSRVRTGSTQARLELRAGEAWLAPRTAVVVSTDRVDLVRGDLLVASGGSLAARWGDVEASGAGVFRLTPGFAPRVAVYRGTIALQRPGEQVLVQALRQVDLGVRRLQLGGSPLHYRADDPWDRALLPAALAFDGEVDRLIRGIDREFGTSPQPAAFYREFAAVETALLPLLARAVRVGGTSTRAFGPPSEALVTLFVAEAAAHRAETSAAAMIQRVGNLRELGARWGLVAMELELTSADFLAAVDLGPAGSLAAVRELAAAPGAFAVPVDALLPGTAPRAVGQPAEPTQPAATDETGGAPAPGPADRPPGGDDDDEADDDGRLLEPPGPVPVPTIDSELVTDVLDTVSEVVNEILRSGGRLLP